MLRRALLLLLGPLGLAACQSSPPDALAPMNNFAGRGVPALGESSQVAILLPLSGPLGEIGKPMLRAAQLAMSVPGSPALEAKDTHGTPDGAAAAAREAIAGGARMILGPLTSAETAQVGPLARRAGVPVLAFTNDQTQSQPGVWTLGITPGQQVRRLIGAARDAGRQPVAALLPDNEFGKAMADELTRIAVADGTPPPFIRMHGPGAASVGGVVRELAGTAPEGQPLPAGAILLGTTGNDLKAFAQAFAAAKVDRTKVQILGPALWVDPATGSGAMVGGWFAMPDPEARRDLIKQYMEKYKDAPPGRVDLAHDAASIARVLSGQGRMNTQGLTQAAGFTGVDGWFALLPDGQVRRGLAVFRVDRSRAIRVSAAPAAGS